LFVNLSGAADHGSHASRFLVSAATAACAPALLGATDKGGTKAPILGQDDHQYEAIHDWGELPRTIKYGQHAWRLRRFARKYLHPSHRECDQREPGHAGGFDHDGKFVRSWGRQFKGGAHGLTIRKEGSEDFLYLCDFQHAS